MELVNIIFGVIHLAISAGCGTYTCVAARRKGPLISNPWLFMPKEMREKRLAELSDADLGAEYRQLAIVFGFLTLIFAYLGLRELLPFDLPGFPVWIMVAALVVYAIVSSGKSFGREFYD